MQTQTKICTKCKAKKTLDDFNKQKGGKYGVHSYCKMCLADRNKQYAAKKKERIAAYKKQYAAERKEQIAERQKQYRAENKERIAERVRQYAAENKERIAEYRKQYYAENREQILERQKQYAAEHKDKKAAYDKQRHAENKEKRAEYYRQWQKDKPEKTRAINRKRRALKKAVQENFTPFDEGITRAVYHRKCFRCGSTDNLCIDHHKPLSAGNALELVNAVLLCRSCNASKGAKEPITFYTANELLRRMTYRKMQEAIAETLRGTK